MNDEVGEETRSRGGERVIIDRPTYDELQFEESFRPLDYNRLKVCVHIRDCHFNLLIIIRVSWVSYKHMHKNLRYLNLAK